LISYLRFSMISGPGGRFGFGSLQLSGAEIE
jgi:hypothetical protein